MTSFGRRLRQFKGFVGTPGGGRTRTTYTASRVVCALGVDSSGVSSIKVLAALNG